MNRRALVLLLALAALWGASYLFIKIGLRGMSAAEIVTVRTGLAALVLLPVALRRGALSGLRGKLPLVVLLGAVNMAGPLTLIGLGEHHVATSVTGILIAAAPIYTALLAPFVDPTERSSGLPSGASSRTVCAPGVTSSRRKRPSGPVRASAAGPGAWSR